MTVYANILNNEIRGVYDLLPKQWGDHDNFHLKCAVDDNFMRENGFVRIVRDTTTFDPSTHCMSDFPWYTIENGEVIEHRDILELPQAQEETPE